MRRESGTPTGGPRGHQIAGYTVRCIWINREGLLYFDPHHPGYTERASPPGFTLADPAAPWSPPPNLAGDEGPEH